MSIRTVRSIQIAILLLALLLGGIIYASLFPIGIGVSTDGVSYLMTASNLANGHGYLSYDNSPLTWWPPLYPTLLAVLHRLTGADLLLIAFWFNVATFVATVVFTLLLARQLFSRRPVLIFWAVLMATGTPVMVAAAQNAGTDYLAALLVLPALYFAGRYIQKPSVASWVWLFVLGMLSALQRYNGVTVIALAGLVVFFYTPGSFWRKAAYAAGQGAALIPLVLWGLRNIAVGTGPFGPRVPALNTPLRNIYLTFRVLLRWLIPDWVFEPHQLRTQVAFGAFLLVLALVLAAGFYLNHRRKRGDLHPVAIPVVGYSVLFLVALIVNASLAYFKDITERFLVPVYIPLILTGLIALEVVTGELRVRLPRRAAAVALFVLLIAVPVAVNWNAIEQTPDLIAISRIEGVEPDNMYVNREWQNNPAVLRVRALHNQNADVVFYSNLPAGIALSIWEPAYWSPLKNHSVFVNEKYLLGNYQTAFASCSADCYLVWLLPHPYDHMYPPYELKRVVQLEEVFTSEQGVIYRIEPLHAEAGTQ